MANLDQELLQIMQPTGAPADPSDGIVPQGGAVGYTILKLSVKYGELAETAMFGKADDGTPRVFVVVKTAQDKKLWSRFKAILPHQEYPYKVPAADGNAKVATAAEMLAFAVAYGNNFDERITEAHVQFVLMADVVAKMDALDAVKAAVKGSKNASWGDRMQSDHESSEEEDDDDISGGDDTRAVKKQKVTGDDLDNLEKRILAGVANQVSAALAGLLNSSAAPTTDAGPEKKRPMPDPAAFGDHRAAGRRSGGPGAHVPGAVPDDLSPAGGAADETLSPPAPAEAYDIVVGHHIDHNTKGDAHEFRKLQLALRMSGLIDMALIDAMVSYSRPGGSARTVFIKFSSVAAAAEFLKTASGVCTNKNESIKMVIKRGQSAIEFRKYRRNPGDA